MKILLYGYYDQGNFGDELFDLFFSKYFDKKQISYIKLNPAKLELNFKQIEKVDLIFLGGGEIINDYFMIPLFEYIIYHNLYNVSIYGASIGYSINLSNKYLNFFDKCIFRNNLQIVNNQNYFFDNDIIFGLNHIINLKELSDSIIVDLNTIGFYMIDKITTTDMTNIIGFIRNLNPIYKIRFVVFDKKFDPDLINQLIMSTKIPFSQYEIIIPSDPIDTIKWILKSEKHFCMRFHAHIICYMFKRQFISYPLTNKTIEFNTTHNIKFSKNPDELIYLLDGSSNIIFDELKFNMKLLDKMFILDNNQLNLTDTNQLNLTDNNQLNLTDNNQLILTDNNLSDPIDKRTTLWFIITEIYMDFINNINLIDSIDSIDSSIPDSSIPDLVIENIINNIIDKIELNILNSIDTPFRYGLIEKINDIIKKRNDKTYKIKYHFIKMITDL
jgi:hypothetical protein